MPKTPHNSANNYGLNSLIEYKAKHQDQRINQSINFDAKKLGTI